MYGGVLHGVSARPARHNRPGIRCRAGGITVSEPMRMTDEHRENFWRRCGWSPELPESERMRIEQRWDDESIDLAELFGW
ncbi:hypothetical protein NFA_50290 [Nocardia farcinica IFM 10152]|uniref:Uncharacterized protein n=2 Tax=Nocardia farcinica TaxID=37329 RepID=Q5YPL0_NOCFA|nr:hypothetical protein NFA_50290 [Nocardia farcinica IFM 10152]